MVTAICGLTRKSLPGSLASFSSLSTLTLARSPPSRLLFIPPLPLPKSFHKSLSP